MRLFIFHNLLLTGLLTITSRPLFIQMQLRQRELDYKGNQERQEEKAVRMRYFGWVRDKGGSGTSDEGF